MILKANDRLQILLMTSSGETLLDIYLEITFLGRIYDMKTRHSA